MGAGFCAPVRTDHGAHPSSYTVGTGSCLWVKTCGHVDHPPPSGAKIKERIELYIHPHSRTLWPVLGRTVPIPPLCAVLVVLYTVILKVGCSEIYVCVYHGCHSCILAVTFLIFFPITGDYVL